MNTSVKSESEFLALTTSALERDFQDHVRHTLGKDPRVATQLDHFVAAARTVRDRLADRWTRTVDRVISEQPKRVYYLSMEFLLGRLLEDALVNLGAWDEMKEALLRVGVDPADVFNQEHDAGLGNGGLGRLAACFLDSMATLGIPGMGYGIRYQFGIFRQDIVRGQQVERPDNWLRYGNPWEFERPERRYAVHFGGRVIQYTSPNGRMVAEWVDTDQVLAVAYDTPIPGYQNDVVNTLRLWSAKATQAFELEYFNRGDYIRAVEQKAQTESISRVLYPNDSQLAGKELRLKQEYFLVSATLQDALSRHLSRHADATSLPKSAIFQLNDTHPALAVAELMRLLVDRHQLDWDLAWTITSRCMAYTNHTILPEALERWPVWMLERLLPRHLQIIYEINDRFLREVRARFPGDQGRVQRMSLIQEGPERQVRMAHLAIVGAHRVNGVSGLHSRLLREQLFRDFHEFYPAKFTNQTNGVTPRRWLMKCNPGLSALITDRIGPAWKSQLSALEGLEAHADDPEFQAAWRAVKEENKLRFARFMRRQHGVELDPAHLVDSQVKRIHEYKRQLLNVIHVVARYLSLREDPSQDVVPRTFVFAGKAAPGYAVAKELVRLINAVAAKVNADARVRGKLAVLFVPNYGVTQAELIIPASDVSEQISTAGMEASGTGNMKFALNGALTIGTLDGANIEMRQCVGQENIFIFGLTTEEILAASRDGYDPRPIIQADAELRTALDAIESGMFNPDEPARFKSLVDALVAGGDRYFVVADYRSYALTQRTLEQVYRQPAEWTRRSILNVARMGWFSSDRTIAGYAREIWDAGVAAP
ncbi:MAG: glycogen/starch/alpha-glucan phosphorylase [Polyangiaceae bacterium]